MRFFVGTSGYGYKEWRGRFYPEKFPDEKMLSYYAGQFDTVEINNSFRRMPSEGDVKTWAAKVPGAFRFAIKAPQTITHHKQLKNAARETSELLRVASLLKRRQGPILFQLPPNFKKDLLRLKTFLQPFARTKTKAAFEFRHASWFDDEVFSCLRANGCALCVADAEELPKTDLVRTTSWGYVRLRRASYSKQALLRWIERMRAQRWKEVWVFFKHEETGTGPKLARRFFELAEASERGPA